MGMYGIYDATWYLGVSENSIYRGIWYTPQFGQLYQGPAGIKREISGYAICTQSHLYLQQLNIAMENNDLLWLNPL